MSVVASFRFLFICFYDAGQNVGTIAVHTMQCAIKVSEGRQEALHFKLFG